MGKTAYILLGIWLILSGLSKMTNIGILSDHRLLSIIAIVAGFYFIFTAWPVIELSSIGMILLALWLIAQGAIGLFHLPLPLAGKVIDGIAIAAGILLLLK